MKKLFFAAACLVNFISWAQEKNLPTFNAKLTHANIYFAYGAQLTHTANIDVQKGMQEIILQNVSTTADGNTIQITCPENIVLLSHRFATKTETNTVINPVIAKMDDSIKGLQKQLTSINNDYALQEELLKKTSALLEGYTSSGSKHIDGEEIIKLIEFYTAKIQTYKTSLYSIAVKRDDCSDNITAINIRRNEAVVTGNKTTTKTTGQIVLQIMAKSSGTADVEASYFTNYAGWVPSYEMRVKSIDNSFKLGYKAMVTQNTGIDWKQAKITLSTNNPNQSNQSPILNAQYVQTYLPYMYDNLRRNQVAAAQNSIQSLDEVVVTGAATAKYKRENKDFTSSVSNYLQVNESQLFTSFEIDLPYDIPCDGKGYSVAIKEEEIKATYKHYAVPKLDRDAFLMAEISDWETLDLLPGQANIIMDGRYVGKSYIDPNTTADTLNISLGRDKRVSLKRTLVKDGNHKPKIKGDNKTETFTYEVVVKNNKKQTINLLLKDQYPLSREKEIEVILIDDGGAEVNTELGILNWKVELAASESKKIRFTYSVKYPKDKMVNGLR